jgi:hypothetical protein
VLPTTPFEAWHGLLVEPVRGAPLLVGLLVSLAWGAVCLDAARRSFRRRDFAGDGRAPVSWARFGRGVVVGLAVAAVLAAGAAFDRTWITSHRLEGSVAATFRNLVVQQQDLIGQAERTASLRVFPFCKREGTVSGPGAGAGDDWRCQLYVDGPRLRGLSADYSLTVRPNGCYTAEGPPAVIGPPRIHRAGGGAVVNPLYAFDGCMIVG